MSGFTVHFASFADRQPCKDGGRAIEETNSGKMRPLSRVKTLSSWDLTLKLRFNLWQALIHVVIIAKLRKLLVQILLENESQEIGTGDAYHHWTEISVDTFPFSSALWLADSRSML